MKQQDLARLMPGQFVTVKKSNGEQHIAMVTVVTASEIICGEQHFDRLTGQETTFHVTVAHTQIEPITMDTLRGN